MCFSFLLSLSLALETTQVSNRTITMSCWKKNIRKRFISCLSTTKKKRRTCFSFSFFLPKLSIKRKIARPGSSFQINQSMDKLTESASGNNKTLVIILTVTLPTLACLVVLIGIVVCYRRRATTIWLKQSDNSDRLQAILINLSPSSIQPQYYQNKFCLSHSQFAQPKTQTIVYNRLIVTEKMFS